MENLSTGNLVGRPDWKWVGVSYCFFVVYHLLPTIVMIAFFRGGLGLGWNVGSFLWMFFGLALVGIYVGYKSVGITIIEPAISSVAYVLTLMVALHSAWNLPYGLRSLWTSGAVILAAVAIVIVSAWIGETIQARRRIKNQQERI